MELPDAASNSSASTSARTSTEGLFLDKKCVICLKGDDLTLLTALTSKGLHTLDETSRIRGDTALNERLLSQPDNILVHNSCRKVYTDPRKLKRIVPDDHDESLQRNVRSKNEAFHWKEHCFFCNKPAIFNQNDTDTKRAMSCELRTTVKRHCALRADKWGLQVLGRLESCCDLPAEEAVYHRLCYLKFTTGRSFEDKPSNTGRHDDEILSDAFLKLCNWLEANCESEMYTLQELANEMQNICGDSYSPRHLKRKLLEKYDSHIFFAEVCGRKNIICFRNLVSYVLSDKWYSERKENMTDESERLVTAAAKIIASEIRDIKANKSEYPSAADILAEDKNYIPPLLQTFMNILVPSKVKCTSISQCIVQAARSRTVLMPLQLGLGVSMDHAFASKALINELARLGFCVSYDEVLRFKQCAVSSIADEIPANSVPDSFTQWVADNVDHNVRTLDGYNTFHGMGIISSTAMRCESGQICMPSRPITRLCNRLRVNDLVKNRGIKIVPYKHCSKFGLSFMTLTELRQLQQPMTLPQILNVGLLWHTMWLFKGNEHQRPNWSGYMQHVSSGTHPSAATVTMMPLIDLSPSDETCVYSTLLFVSEQAEKLHIPSPCITFDQPLWLKAVDIVSAEKLNIVCRMGGFHTIMNFLGSIGRVMSGSGLEEVMKINYGADTVTHIMTGKAFSRAFRGHLLLDGALNIKLLKLALQSVEAPSSESSSTTDCDTSVDGTAKSRLMTAQEVADLNDICDSVWKEKLDVSDCRILEHPSLTKLATCLAEIKERLINESRTARLWIQYINYIDIVKKFIIAERTGDCHLHLSATHDMLNLFSATGHYNYAKSTRLYLQMMVDLRNSHPWLYEQFTSHGFHSIRRSDRYWSGLSTDLVIEQVMMKGIKGRSGLTRGRGMDEGVRLVWVKSLHECAAMHFAMKSFTGLTTTAETHADLGSARVKRDCRDLQKIIEWLEFRDPFQTDDGKLRSLASGLTASDDDNINCDDAESVGLKIQLKMNDVRFNDVSMKKSENVRTLLCLQNLPAIGNKALHIDAANLFHRLIILVERSVDIPRYFDHELTGVPTSLFKDSFMRKADKPSLAKVLTNTVVGQDFPQGTQFVLDGGALLHRVKWLKNTTYSEIVQQYVHFVRNKQGINATVVFDGYSSQPSTKDHEHQRRYCKSSKRAPEVSFTDSSPVVVDQQAFLANDVNKNRFIHLLMTALNSVGCCTFQADSDADTIIVSKALHLAREQRRNVCVVADDTDILILLLHHLTDAMADIFFLSLARKRDEGKPLSIRSVQKSIGPSACKQILTIHALGGCDTTSAIFGLGKGTVFKRISKCASSDNLTAIMHNIDSTHHEVNEAGLQLLVLLFGGKSSENLNSLRYAAYCKMAALSLARPQPERLPPTERAAYFHLMRVHLQAVRWKNLSADEMDPGLWGWRVERDKFVPIMTDLPAAPDDILNVVRCKCKTGCKASSNCSCRANSLTCVSACSNCHGDDCSNSDPTTNEEADVETGSASEGEPEVEQDDEEDVERQYCYDSDIDWECEEEV